jgi:hypothetical protein
MSAVGRWGVVWRRAGPAPERWVMWWHCEPLLFRSRADARTFIHKEWGYIATRPDLQRAPHYWRIPGAVRVTVTVQER